MGGEMEQGLLMSVQMMEVGPSSRDCSGVNGVGGSGIIPH